MRFVFSKKEYKVFQCIENRNYIVINTKKPFEEGHTHVQHYHTAMYLVDCAIHKKIPKKVNRYFLVSLTRISKDTKYKERIQRVLDGEEPKETYINRPKSVRR